MPVHAHGITVMWGETGGSKTLASRTFYSRFPPPFVGVPASLFYFCCEMLRNIAKFSSFSPGSRRSGNPAPASRTPPTPYSPGLPPPVPLHCNDTFRKSLCSFLCLWNFLNIFLISERGEVTNRATFQESKTSVTPVVLITL